MCGRFVSPEEATIERYWHLGRRNNPNPFARRFNVFPTDTIPFLRLPSSSDELELAAGRWGLVPHWWKEAKPPKTTFNARLEEAAGKPMWRDAWARARCLVPAEGWYEWQAVERVDPATGEIKKAKEPHFIRRKDGGLLCFAGLASYWKNPRTGEALRSCAIVTAEASGLLAEIHALAPDTKVIVLTGQNDRANAVKTIALGALVGAVMGKLGRKANAAVVNRILTERLA